MSELPTTFALSAATADAAGLEVDAPDARLIRPDGRPLTLPATWQLSPGQTLVALLHLPAGLKPGGVFSVSLRSEGRAVGWVRLEWFDHVPGSVDEPPQCSGCTFWPGLPVRFVVPLDLLDGQHLKLPRHAGMLSTFCPGRGITPAEVRCVRVMLAATILPQTVTLHAITCRPSTPEPMDAPAALIDELGQRADFDWPGKTRDADELARLLAAEHQRTRLAPAAQRAEAPTPSARDRFRAVHDGHRWWFERPDGTRFFSVGPDCVGTNGGGPVLPGSGPLFSWLPPRDGRWKEAWRDERTLAHPTINFLRANLIRTFGDEWESSWRELTAARLRDWGFNTIGNWSDLGFIASARLPYVWPCPAFPTTAVTLFRDLPDVFAPDYAADAARCAAVLADRARDPWLIGYFLRNEPHWAFGAHNLASRMLEQHPGTHSRRELARWLATRYAGDAAACSRAWDVPLRAFDDVVTRCFSRLAESSPGAAADLLEFSRLLVRAYVEIPSRACRAVAPDVLNLGVRYAYLSSDLILEGGAAFDVFSINCYQLEPPLSDIDRIVAATGRPVLIGEFHFGALDRGLPSTGLRGVASQADRGKAYRRFVELCAAHPGMVGAHYFQWNDQAVHGRFDGENYQIGCIDVCSQPYAEFRAAARATHAALDAVARGEQPPTDERPVEIPRTTL